MAILLTLYSDDASLLGEITSAVEKVALQTTAPAEVSAPGSLNLDIATISSKLWEVLVAFGGLKASLEAIQIVIKLLRERAANGRASKVEVSLPGGVKLVFESSMTPDQLALAVSKYRSAIGGDEASDQTTGEKN